MAILSYDQHFPAFPSFADENNWRCALMLLWLLWTWNASKKWIWSPLKMLLENADNVFLQAYRWKKHREIIGTRPFYNLVPIASLFFFLFGFFAEIPKLELGRKAQATIWQVGRSVHWLVHKKAAAERFDCGQVPPNQPRKFQTFDEITVQTKHNCFRFPDTYLFRLTDSWTECIQ